MNRMSYLHSRYAYGREFHLRSCPQTRLRLFIFFFNEIQIDAYNDQVRLISPFLTGSFRLQRHLVLLNKDINNGS